VAYVRTTHALAGLEKLIEFFEYAPSQHGPLGVPLDSNFVATGVDFDSHRPFDQSKRLFAVPVEGNGRRIIIEGQALVGRCIFSSQ